MDNVELARWTRVLAVYKFQDKYGDKKYMTQELLDIMDDNSESDRQAREKEKYGYTN